MSLAGLVLFVSSTGQPQYDAETVNLATGLGATVTHDVTHRVNAIISDTSAGPWYLAVTACNPKVMILKRSWLQACAAAGAQVSCEGHQLACLAGCKISLTGVMEAAQREEMASLIKSLGAEFSADMKRDCTHLVASSSTQPKYKYAMSWGLLTVSPAWLTACHKQNLRQDESKYPVQAGSQGTQGTTSSGATGAPIGPGTSTRSITLAQGVAGGSTGRTTSYASDAAAGAASRGQPSSRPAQPLSKPLPSAFALAPEDPVTGNWLFLDWVRYFPMGLTAEEVIQVRKLAAQGAAVREMTLNRNVTHIIVGSQPTASELALAKEHWVNWKEHVRVVQLQWLYECAVQRCSLEPVEPSLLFPLANVTTRASSLTEPSGLTTAPSGSSSLPAWLPPATTSVDFCDLAAMADTRTRAGDGSWLQQPSGPTVQERTLPSDKNRMLESLWFTLVAAPHDKELAKLVRLHGGQVFTAESLRKIKDMSQAFALCPPGMPPHVVQDLEKTAADFRAIPGTHRVTGYWLEECIRLGRLQNPIQDAQLAFRPMPFEVPLAALPPGFTIHVSGLGVVSVRRGMNKLLEILGASVSNDLNAHVTHVLLPEVPSKPKAENKYDGAIKFGAIAVNEAWVTQLAQTGRMPDPWDKRFRPAKETPQQKEEMKQKALRRIQAPREQQAANAASKAAGFPMHMGPTQLSTQAAAAEAGMASKSIGYTSATGFRLTAADAARQAQAEEQALAAKPQPARQTHPSGIPVPAPSSQQQPVAPAGKQMAQRPTWPAADQPAAGPSHSRDGQGRPTRQLLPASSHPPTAAQRQPPGGEVQTAQHTVSRGSDSSHALPEPQGQGGPGSGSSGAITMPPPPPAPPPTITLPPPPELPGQQPDACSRDCTATAAAPDGPAAAQRRPGPPVPDTADDDLDDLQTSIQALIQTHGRAGSTADLNFSQMEVPLAGPCVSGMAAASGTEPSKSSGAASGLMSSMGQAGDVSSKLQPGEARKTNKRQARVGEGMGHGLKTGRMTRASNASHQGLGEMEMSQQVGYDAPMDESLLHSKSASANRNASSGNDQHEQKQAFIKRVLRIRGTNG